MNIKVLDCTLRDGAYVLNGKFGASCISGVVNSLIDGGIDIVERGWLKDFEHEEDSVYYNQPDEIVDKRPNTALMLDLGRYNIDNINTYSGYADIIRVAFYKKDFLNTAKIVEALKNRGYKVFLQASYILEYSDKEIIELCKIANSVDADALYIVDTFGSMLPDDLSRIMPIFSENVNNTTTIGFHAHNNIQLALALTLQFIQSMKRDIIVDSSLCGIGRGIGNTQTELLLEILNKNGKTYNTEPIWRGIKNYIEPIMERYSWKYNPKNAYLGINGLHPNTEI